MVILETNMGEIHINVDADKAPISAKNFTDYVEDGFFDGTIFHRVIPGFMVQGGGMTEDMQQKPTKANIENEAKNGLKNVKYSLAMARTAAPHSASSQFFINVNDNQFLDFLTIESSLLPDKSYEIKLIFSGDAIIKICAEVIDITLDDQGSPWESKTAPKHTFL